MSPDPFDDTLPVPLVRDGVHRVIRDAEGGYLYCTLECAPELSTRYEVPRTEFLRRQAE